MILVLLSLQFRRQPHLPFAPARWVPVPPGEGQSKQFRMSPPRLARELDLFPLGTLTWLR